MKLLSIIMFSLFLIGCSSQKTTTLSYSSEFKLSISTEFFTGATVFSSDELSVKTDSGMLLSGRTISNEVEALPRHFDIRNYPEYVLKIKPVKGLTESLLKKFEYSSSEIDHVYGLENIKITENGNWTMYSVCKKNKCLAYVVKNTFKDHILSINTVGFNHARLRKLINRGFLYVKP